jgi:hypothetical protein
MRKKKVMAGDVRLGGGIAAEVATSASARGEEGVSVAMASHHLGLVDGEPKLHPIAVCLKAKICECCEIRPAKIYDSHNQRKKIRSTYIWV